MADAGTNNLLEFGVGARAQALGGAYVAIADDAGAMFWNPAGLAQLDQMEVAAMHVPLYYDTPYDFLGFAYPLLDWGTFGVGAMRVGTDGLVLRDEHAVATGDGTGSYDQREYLFSFGRELPYQILGGASLKIDQERLLGDYSIGVGLDVGGMYQLPMQILAPTIGRPGVDEDALTAGVSLQNLWGSHLKLKNEMDVFPLNVQAGLCYQYGRKDSLNQVFRFTGEVEKSTWRSLRVSGGLEYSLLDMFAVRGGVNSDSWSLGAGLKYQGFMLDYCLGEEALGMTHRVSLGYRFGPKLTEQRAAREAERQAALAQEAEAQARAAVEAARQEMEKALATVKRRYRAERQGLMAESDRRAAAERQREYFKALHYFQGVKDNLAYNYAQALTEFETVAKFDPKYLDVQRYLAEVRQKLGGKVQFLNQANLTLYYQGIDQYVDEKFEDAIGTWKKILVTEPNNVLAMRNIEEAEYRLSKLKSLQENAPQEMAPVLPEATPGTAPKPAVPKP